ncbi:hypothetical protein [Streptomyces sp. NPDC017993]|uniref:hypothetical protein n=1 Tax=Streptomyces sp. NPDC017993 TaxID=3365027 RepID=UPI0037935BC7
MRSVSSLRALALRAASRWHLRPPRRPPRSGAAPPRERFAITVTENRTGVGGRFRCGNSALGYRVDVTDVTTGRTQYVSENFTYRLAYADGEKYLRKLVAGTKRLR